MKLFLSVIWSLLCWSFVAVLYNLSFRPVVLNLCLVRKCQVTCILHFRIVFFWLILSKLLYITPIGTSYLETVRKPRVDRESLFKTQKWAINLALCSEKIQFILFFHLCANGSLHNAKENINCFLSKLLLKSLRS